MNKLQKYTLSVHNYTILVLGAILQGIVDHIKTTGVFNRRREIISFLLEPLSSTVSHSQTSPAGNGADI
jgi:hypothetical protein